MVVFTCNNCGESVNKPKVEKHIQYECKRKNFAVSFCCVDCLKDFNIETVKDHCQCVTEDERYSGKGYVAKASAEKGKRKQAGWVDIVQSVINRKDLPNDERQFLSIIAKFDNVPRKKNKFQNFCFSTAPAYRKKGWIVDKVFDTIEAEYKAQQAQNLNDTSNTQNKNDTESLEKNGSVQEESQEIKGSQKADGDDGNANTETVETLKNKKKKSKKSLDVANNEVEAKSLENNDPQPEKKKKKKGKKIQEDSTTISVENVEVNSSNPADVQLDSGKKSKKNKKKSTAEESNGINENGTSKTDENIMTNGENGILCENTESQLSKKEKKELKKKMKYQGELASVTNNIIETDKEPISKKKKRKLNSNEENEEPQQKLLKIEETSQVTEVQSGRKFYWNEAISQVLQSKKNKPMSKSKLLKRVMNEYHFLNKETTKSESDLEKIFFKKLRKMKSVQVDNDKVQLV